VKMALAHHILKKETAHSVTSSTPMPREIGYEAERLAPSTDLPMRVLQLHPPPPQGTDSHRDEPRKQTALLSRQMSPPETLQPITARQLSKALRE
jgi:hypothetical protein